MGFVIVAAADGSSLANPGPSGWAWYIDDLHWAAGGWARGTNNMGELMSVLDLLRATSHTDESLKVLCDSQYAINCCTRWIPAWKKRGWRKADNKPVLNLDLMKQLDDELKGRRVTFQWVKGHSGHPLNEKADDLARAAATAYQQGTPVSSGPGFSSAPPVRAPDTEPQSEDSHPGPASDTTSPSGPSIPGLPSADDLLTSALRDDAQNPDTDALIPLPPDPITRPQPDLLSVANDRSNNEGSGEARTRETLASASAHRDGVSDSSSPTPTSSGAPRPDERLAPTLPPESSGMSGAHTPSTTAHPRPTPDPSTVVDITELTRELMSDETQLDRERLDELMHPEFVAHLPNGLIRTKGSILARPAELSGSVQLDVLGADRLNDDALLLRFRLRRNSQDFLCAILWQRGKYGWQARFQQMTTVATA